MFDYRNNLKTILKNTKNDEKSLKNSLNAIKSIIQMTDVNNLDKRKSIYEKEMDSNKVDNEINNLLESLIKLIQNPGNSQDKKSTLSAIHQLTFNPAIGKTFGKKLGALDLAVQNSATTKESIDRKLFQDTLKSSKSSMKDLSQTNRQYTIIRKLVGADLINKNNQIEFSIFENQIHSLNLKSGDIVTAEVQKGKLLDINVVGYKKLRKRDYEPITIFKYAVVRKHLGKFYVSSNIRGQKLKINNKNFKMPVDSSYYQNQNIQIEDGSIVDIAWYKNSPDLKKDVRIRWIYDINPSTEFKEKLKKQKSKQIKRDKTAFQELDLNLHFKRVGIAIGNNQNEKILEEFVTKYNGIPVPIDAFNGKKKQMEQQIKDLDIVILITAFSSHDSAWNIREFASKHNIKFAVSSSKGYKSFERALYRADKGLPAYEGNLSINYKLK